MLPLPDSVEWSVNPAVSPETAALKAAGGVLVPPPAMVTSQGLESAA